MSKLVFGWKKSSDIYCISLTICKLQIALKRNLTHYTCTVPARTVPTCTVPTCTVPASYTANVSPPTHLLYFLLYILKIKYSLRDEQNSEISKIEFNDYESKNTRICTIPLKNIAVALAKIRSSGPKFEQIFCNTF